MTMDRELVQAWIDALRSGKYRQGQYVLRSADDKYCCLGVAHDITGDGWREEIQHENYGFVHDFYITDDGWVSGISSQLQDRLGLNSCLSHQELVNLNDGGASFTEIADRIERDILHAEGV